jgi:hypothetical protein
LFRVSNYNGQAFIATAELLGIDKDDLLDKLMGSYVASVQKSIIVTAEKLVHPVNAYLTQHVDFKRKQEKDFL